MNGLAALSGAFWFTEAGAAWPWLFSSLVKSTVWLAVGLVLTRPAARVSAAARHARCIVFALGVPVVFLGNLSPLPETQGWKPWPRDAAPEAIVGVATFAALGTSGSAASSGAFHPSALAPTRAPALRSTSVALWATGVLLGFGLLLSAVLRRPASGIWTTCINPATLAILQAECASLRLRRVPSVWTANQAMPGVCGLFRPRLLLPQEALSWNVDHLRDILRHELLHVVRRDLWWECLSRLALLPVWFHPFAWILRRRLATSREEACDDGVLRAGSSPPDYAERLLAAATPRSLCLNRGTLSAHGPTLRIRIRRILNAQPVDRQPASCLRTVLGGGCWLAAGAAATLAVGCTTVAPLAEPPQTGQTPPPALALLRPGEDVYLVSIRIAERTLPVGQSSGIPRLDQAIRGEITTFSPEEGWQLFFSPDLRGADLLSLPTILVKPGQEGTVELEREFIYPTAYDPPTATHPAVPTQFDTTWTGVRCSVRIDPRDSTSVDMDWKSEIREFEGFAEDRAGGNTLPVIDALRKRQAGTFLNGTIFIIGTREDEQQWENRVPVLGRIPGLGRLFRKSGTDRLLRIAAVRIEVLNERESGSASK